MPDLIAMGVTRVRGGLEAADWKKAASIGLEVTALMASVRKLDTCVAFMGIHLGHREIERIGKETFWKSPRNKRIIKARE